MEPKAIFRRFRAGVAKVVIEGADGVVSSGTCFHAGDGCFVTAAHVVNAGAIRSIVLSDLTTALAVDTWLAPNSRTDIAVIKADVSPTLTQLQLGHFFQDWMPESIVMDRVVIIGFPRIPGDRDGVMVATLAEVNAVFPHYLVDSSKHLLLSTSAEGGYSGGPVIGSDGTVLGVVTEATRSP